MAISETKGQGWTAILIQWKKASDISWPPCPAATQKGQWGKGSRGSFKLLCYRLQQEKTIITLQETVLVKLNHTLFTYNW